MVAGSFSPGTATALNNPAHVLDEGPGESTQAATKLANELSLATGAVALTGRLGPGAVPKVESIRLLRTVAAALPIPVTLLAGAPTSWAIAGLINCANAHTEATVVSSFMTTGVALVSVLIGGVKIAIKTDASLLAAPALPPLVIRYSSVVAGGGAKPIANAPLAAETALPNASGAEP